MTKTKFDKIKATLSEGFEKNPKVLFNLLFWSLLLIVFISISVAINWQKGTDETYVKRKISELRDEERLDTLIKLTKGSEVTIRDFPYINTYTAKIKSIKNVDNDDDLEEFPGSTRYFINTKGFSFIPISNSKYLFRKNNKEWQRDSIENATFGAISDQLLAYYNDNVAVPLLVKGPNKDKSFDYLRLSATSVKRISVPKHDSLSKKRLYSGYYSSLNNLYYYWESSFTRRFSFPSISLSGSMRSSIYSVDLTDQSINSFSLDSVSRFISFEPDFGTAYYFKYKDQTLKTNSLIGLNIDRSRANTLIPSVDLKNYLGLIYNNDNVYCIFKNKDSIKINFIPDLLGKPQTKNFKVTTKKDTLLQSSYDIDIVNNNLWITFKVSDSLKLLKSKLSENGEIRKSDILDLPIANLQRYRGNLIQYSKKDIIYNFTNDEGDRSFFITDGKTKTNSGKEDAKFFDRIKEAKLYVPRYFDGIEYIANYNSGLFVVDVVKNGNQYDYKFIGNIDWSGVSLEVRSDLDKFYLIILITAVITAYFVFYFIFRNYFGSYIVSFNYDEDQIFKRLPLLSKKMETIENDMRQLKLRSDYMLVLGITFGIGGVLASIITFQATEKTIGDSWNSPHTFLGIFRPVVLLAFIEMFTFYFLKQYRIIFNEYKRFYSTFLNLCSYFNILELFEDNAKDLNSKAKSTINTRLSTDLVSLHENNTLTQIDEFSHDSILKLIEAMDKFKK